LLQAARKGKEVTVVVELMARFDEEANLHWAAKLEEAGAHVVYGVVGHKTHAKMMLVVRRELIDGCLKLRRYVHLGTGNYHPRTARVYTDLGLFTANKAICADVHEVFQQITGLGQAQKLQCLWQAPFTMQRKVIQAIKQETQHAKSGKKAHIIAKMNSLLESETIQALYEASQAGVKIELIIRGVCALRPGLPGVSEHIHVRSVIGRFLEHSRIFYFLNVGAHDLYLSSADWMERNFFKRVEIAFPVLDKKIKQRIFDEVLNAQLNDNQLAWKMSSDGSYTKIRHRKQGFSSQEYPLHLLTD
jgi:polyphosphate kinase